MNSASLPRRSMLVIVFISLILFLQGGALPAQANPTSLVPKLVGSPVASPVVVRNDVDVFGKALHPNDTSALVLPAASHLRKRGLLSLIDLQVMGPMINSGRPVVEYVVDFSFNKTAAQISDALPGGLRTSMRVVLGIDPVQKHAPRKCGYFQALCDYLFPSYDQWSFAVRQRVVAAVTRSLQARRAHVTDLMLAALKRKVYLSEEARGTVAPRSWYEKQVARYIAVRMASPAGRELLHEALSKFAADQRASVINAVRDTVNRFLPVSLQLASGSRKSKRGIVNVVVQKLVEWERAVLVRATAVIEGAAKSLETEVVQKTSKAFIVRAMEAYDQHKAAFSAAAEAQ